MRSVDGDKASFKNVRLTNAVIHGQLSFIGAIVRGNLEAAGIQVHTLLMLSDRKNKTSFREMSF